VILKCRQIQAGTIGHDGQVNGVHDGLHSRRDEGSKQ